MLFSTYDIAVLTMARTLFPHPHSAQAPCKASRPIAGAMSQVLGQMPPEWRRTVTLTTGPSLHSITGSTNWASRPSSAIPTPPGRREGWRTP